MRDEPTLIRDLPRLALLTALVVLFLMPYAWMLAA